MLHLSLWVLWHVAILRHTHPFSLGSLSSVYSSPFPVYLGGSLLGIGNELDDACFLSSSTSFISLASVCGKRNSQLLFLRSSHRLLGSQTSHFSIKGHCQPPIAPPFCPTCHTCPSYIFCLFPPLHPLPLSPSTPQATLESLLIPALSYFFLWGQGQAPRPPSPEFQSEFGVCRLKPEFRAMSFVLGRLSRSSRA